MDSPSLDHVRTAVIVLGLVALGTASLIYLLMELNYRRQLSRQTRKLLLSSQLTSGLEEQSFKDLWRRCGRSDQEILEEILVDHCRSASDSSLGKAKALLSGLGVCERWIRELRKGRVARRVQAAMRLGYCRDLQGIVALVAATEDPSPQVELAVTLSLGRLKDPRGIRGLVRIAQKPTRRVPDMTLAAALAACGKASPARLAELLHAPQESSRIAGAWALSEVGDASVLRQLVGASRDPAPEVRAKVARALGRIQDENSLAVLHRLALDPVWFVRVRALDALGRLRATQAADAAVRGLGDPVREVRHRAASALRLIGGMTGEFAGRVIATCPRAKLADLVSEWDRAGFLWDLVSGLSTRDWRRYVESTGIAQELIRAGITRALVQFALVFPDLKVRLRLVRHLAKFGSSNVRAELDALSSAGSFDPRVAAMIRKAFAGAPTSIVGASSDDQ